MEEEERKKRGGAQEERGGAQEEGGGEEVGRKRFGGRIAKLCMDGVSFQLAETFFIRGSGYSSQLF